MAERFEPATPPKRPTINDRQIAIALENQGFRQYAGSDCELFRLAYLNDVGYKSTDTALTTYPAIPEHMNKTKNVIWAIGICVNTSNTPPKPLIVKIKTVKNGNYVNHNIPCTISGSDCSEYIHRIGNFPMRLESKPINANPTAYSVSKMISAVNVSNFN